MPLFGAAEERRSGGAEVRRSVGAEVRRCGGAEVRRCGGAEVRRCGGEEVRRCGGAYVVVFVFVCSGSQKVRKSVRQHSGNLKEIALKTGACWLHSLCLN